jgi:hypothetical protein
MIPHMDRAGHFAYTHNRGRERDPWQNVSGMGARENPPFFHRR